MSGYGDNAEDLIADLQAKPPFRVPVPVPEEWNGRKPKHYAASDKATIPGALSSKVVGLSFVDAYPCNLLALDALAEFRSTPDLFLRRNPANEYDANAVEVRAVSGDRPSSVLGHLPAALAARLAPEMDRGDAWSVVRWQVLIDSGHRHAPGLSVDLARG